MEFTVEIRRELNRTFLRLRVPGIYQEDYQLRMIKENEIQGFVPMSARGEEEQTLYEYEITGLTSMKKRYKQRKISRKEMIYFLERVQEVVEEAERYLLDPNRLVLDSEYIFWKDGGYRFCYFPKGTEEMRSSFHRLMDDFVQWTDYQDLGSVKTVFFLHKETMEENYSLKEIWNKLKEQEEEEQKTANEDPEPIDKKSERDWQTKDESGHETRNIQMEEIWEISGDVKEDWQTRQELGARYLKETDNLWTPVKRLLQKRKKPKWGEWDGLYIEEEEL